jgi:predicted enzyme related to lactoylglutathione lyase
MIDWLVVRRFVRTGPEVPMPLQWEQVIVDARDPLALGRWWATALGWTVVGEDADGIEIQPAPGVMPGLLFVAVEEAKSGKNRLHLDFRPQDRDAEVDRLRQLGATLADVGQDDVSWVVLADPEGNEFCVLSGRPATPD